MKTDVMRPESGDSLWVVADRIRFLGGLPGLDLELVEVEVPAGPGPRLTAMLRPRCSMSSRAS